MAAYKQTHREAWVWTLLVCGALFAGIALSVYLSRFTQSPWLVLVVLGTFAGGMAVGIWRVRVASRARREGVRAVLERQGFAVDLTPTLERATTVFAPVEHLQVPLRLRDGASRITWIALHGPSTLFFEHEYVTGSGRTSNEVACTVLIVSAAHASLPGARVGAKAGVWCERPRRLHRLLLPKEIEKVPTGDPRFDRSWVTFGDRGTVAELLTDRVRGLLADSPRGEVWYTGAGFVCCAFRGKLDAENLMRMWARMQRVLTP